MGSEGSGASRAGGEGIHNEDAFLVEEGLGLYVVCDGASGTPAGEVASLEAARALEAFVERSDSEVDLREREIAREVVENAMVHALSAVETAAHSNPALDGLATTITLLLVHGRVGVIGHRGDSRAYLVRRHRLHQLTVDHALAETSDRASGASQEADVFAVDLQPGDTILLCTDGAEEAIQDATLVRTAGDLRPRLLASRIVSAANRLRPDHDATVVVVRVAGDDEARRLELSDPPHPTAFGHALPPRLRT